MGNTDQDRFMLALSPLRVRFTDKEVAAQRRLWKPVCEYLQRYVKRDGTTLDLGAGYCHFINQIESKRKIAVDTDERMLYWFAKGVERYPTYATDLVKIEDSSLDTVFVSNLYEHFDKREYVLWSLNEVHRKLRCGGRIIIIQPNWRYCSKRYFDFFDHQLIFTDRSMVEALRLAHFEIERVVPKFLPFTTKSAYSYTPPWIVRLYLKLPFLWRIFGAQMLIVASKEKA